MDAGLRMVFRIPEILESMLVPVCEAVNVCRDVQYDRLSVEEERAGKWGHNRCHLDTVV